MHIKYMQIFYSKYASIKSIFKLTAQLWEDLIYICKSWFYQPFKMIRIPKLDMSSTSTQKYFYNECVITTKQWILKLSIRKNIEIEYTFPSSDVDYIKI